jgi:hypothetical protein
MNVFNLNITIDILIYFFIIVFSILGTFLIRYSDNKKIKTDPLIGIYKAASQLRKNIPVEKINTHEKLYYPYNRKMKFYSRLGIILILLSAGLSIYKIFW